MQYMRQGNSVLVRSTHQIIESEQADGAEFLHPHHRRIGEEAGEESLLGQNDDFARHRSCHVRQIAWRQQRR